MLRAIYSGGQTGADLAALIAAKRFGLETGGWMPKGFLNASGSHPEFAEKYGIQEHYSPKYPPRTFKNVEISDATIRFAYDWQSPGELCTLKAIHQYKKPSIDVDLNNPKPVKEVVEWLTRFNIEVLNVAGNSEHTYTGTCGEVMDYLMQLFREMGFNENPE
jgi:hypothetical protein